MKKQTSKKNNSYKPDWAPENSGNEFAVRVVKGVQSSLVPAGKLSTNNKENYLKRKHLSVDDYVNGV